MSNIYNFNCDLEYEYINLSNKIETKKRPKRKPLMNTKTIIEKAVKDGKLTVEKGCDMVSKRLKNDYVWAWDRQMFIEKVYAKVETYNGDITYYHRDACLSYIYDKNLMRYKMCIDGKYKDEFFSCYRSDAFYFKKDFETIIIEGCICCKEVCIRNNSIHLWDDGIYRFDRQPSRYAEYHGHIGPRESWTKLSGYGVELEIYCPNRELFSNKIPKDILPERDGSLDETKGIELIGAPYPYMDYLKNKTPWKETLEIAKKFNAKGYNAGFNDASNEDPLNSLYSMHVNISKTVLGSAYDGAKFVVFMNMQTQLCSIVGQRQNIYHGNYGLRPKISACLDPWGEIKTDKYEAVSVRKDRFEVRIFRANLNYPRFLKNIEFCASVAHFVQSASPKLVADPLKGTIAYLEWLNKQYLYNHLKNFLCENKDRFSIFTNTPMPIKVHPKKLKTHNEI